MRRAAAFPAALLAACAAPPQPHPPEPVRLPPLLVERVEQPDRRLPEMPAAERYPGPPVTFSARDADVRLLIPLLAEAAGVSVVMDPGVQGRVTVHLEGVPAREALERVLAHAGLSLVGDEAAAPPFGPTVFYMLPVNVNLAGPATIAARYDVSLELASWLVEARVPW